MCTTYDKIAVIVPVYNNERYVEVCIESIINQTYRNLDIILVDDGSNDNSLEICLRYANIDERIQVIHQENKGVLHAKNTGLSNTDAEYIMFVDSDDWIAERMCEDLYFAMSTQNVDLVASGIIRAYPNGQRKYDYNGLQRGLYIGKDYKNSILPYMLCNGKFFQCGIDPSMAIKLFKKEILHPLIEKAADYNFYYGEDVSVVYPYMLKIDSMIILEECYYYHRQYDNHVAFYTNQRDYEEKIEALYCYLKQCFVKHEERNVLLRQLDSYYLYSLMIKSFSTYKNITQQGLPSFFEQYLFPFQHVEKNSRIVLYGAGKVGQSFYRQLLKSSYCKNIIWIDKNYKKYQLLGLPVEGQEMITADVEYCVIAIADKNVANQIKKELLDLGIPKEIMVWESPILKMW